jgi:tRNA threonylcarbamoyl adenosine modification protein YeaZ
VSWLGLDGALGAFSAALVPASGAPRTATTSGNDALEQGLGAVDAVLAGTPLRELAGIAVGTGPGSFTGMRIALSYAKSLAFASNRPLVGISSYDAVAPPDANVPHAAFVHGRVGIGCVRLRGFGADLVRCGTYEALAEALATRVSPGSVLDSYGAPEGATLALGERDIIVRALPNVCVPPALAIARRAIASPVAGNTHALGADYGEAHYAERNAPADVPRGARRPS